MIFFQNTIRFLIEDHGLLAPEGGKEQYQKAFRKAQRMGRLTESLR